MQTFKANLNMSDPEQGLVDCIESIEKLKYNGMHETANYYHLHINLALCHYLLKDYPSAYNAAKQAHLMILNKPVPSNYTTEKMYKKQTGSSLSVY